jgi:predicted ATP-binding protein involved in virulence
MDGNNCVYVKIDGEKRELKELSSGFISLLKIVQTIVAGYAAQVNENNIADVSGVVLIDEIESHLHVEWQSKIVLLLKKIFPNTIFYIATHSPIVLSQLAHGEAYLLKKDEDGVVRTQMIEHPNNKTIYDVINTGFDVNLNSIKIKNSNLKSQTEAKRILLELLDEKAS